MGDTMRNRIFFHTKLAVFSTVFYGSLYLTDSSADGAGKLMLIIFYAFSMLLTVFFPILVHMLRRFY
jgi:hypothetical protein